MQNELDQLKKSLESGDFSTACDIIAKLEKNQRERIPVKTLEVIIKHGNERERTSAMRILVILACERKDAFEALLQFLRPEAEDRLRYLAIFFIEQHFSAKEVEALPVEIVSSSIQDPVDDIRSAFLNLLLRVSYKVPVKILIDNFFDAFLTDELLSNREKILTLANNCNPIDRSTDSVMLDPFYLINWIRRRTNITSIEIHDLVDEIAGIYVPGGHPFSHIRSLVTSSRTLDSFVYMSFEKVRGHEMHQFNVGILGLFLLEIYVSESDTLKEYIAKLKKWKPEDVVKAWLITAFLHDHAHPICHMLQKAPFIYKQKKVSPDSVKSLEAYDKALNYAYDYVLSSDLRNVYTLFSSGKDKDGFTELKNLITKELTKIQCSYEVKPGEVPDHGIMSAVNLLNRLPSLKSYYIHAEEIVRTSARAIALHNLAKEIVLEKEPILFLLVLCDEIQEWGREIVPLYPTLTKNPLIRMEPFTYKNSKFFFENELKIYFEYFPNEMSDETSLDIRRLKAKKKFTEERLKFANPDIKPQGLRFRIVV
jgi:hypothetical protein